ncbi:hypothetical protein PVT71_12865 [Salipiger sp. H15]|uniref:Uncharacterized protein n=1 Tax=Alloyangia sp. H15 TaxID=3029062 RepID=A0AAU8AEI7_9RHOB
MPLRTACAACLLALLALPAHAAWTLSQGNGAAAMSQSAGATKITFSCSRSHPDSVTVSFEPWRGAAPAAVMLWIELPDGRNDRQSMDLIAADRAAHFALMTSSMVLGNLQQAAALSFTDGGTELARTDARGTGAFRLAVQEQCRF